MSGHDYSALAPEIILLAGSIVTILSGSYLLRHRQWVARWCAILALCASATAAIVASSEASRTVFDGSYAVDVATAAARVIVPIGVILVIVLGRNEIDGTARESETYTLLMLAALGTVLLAGAEDLLILATGFLLASIPLYALIGLGRGTLAAEATLKTYLVGAILGVTMLFGASILFGISGATAYGPLAEGLRSAPPAAVAIGVVALLAGLLFKAGAVPGHFWVPDASQAAGRAVAAFATSVPKVGALLAMLRLVEVVPPGIDVALLIAIIAALSMTLGNLAAFWQQDVRRLLGWSTVSQVGYLMLPIAVAGDGATGALIVFLGGYVLTNVVAFAVVAALPSRATIDGWAGAARGHPWITAALVVALLGLVGTPPTALFFGKLLVFTSAAGGGLWWLAVLAAANTVASLFYYLRWVAAAFRARELGDGTPPVALERERVDRAPAVVAVTGAAFVIASGLVALPLATLLALPLVR